jgi:hypothetical protein
VIISFPSLCWNFIVFAQIPKDTKFTAYFMDAGIQLVAPIELKPNDQLLVDLRSRHLETVEREGLTVWHSGWLN